MTSGDLFIRILGRCQKGLGLKRFLVLVCLFSVSACGTIGIGSNHETRLYNNSGNTITVSADNGIFKIQPGQEKVVYSNNDITIKSENPKCSEVAILRRLNTAAVVLDVFPIGWMFGILPVFIDAISNNMYRMPRSYSYSCAE